MSWLFLRVFKCMRKAYKHTKCSYHALSLWEVHNRLFNPHQLPSMPAFDPCCTNSYWFWQKESTKCKGSWAAKSRENWSLWYTIQTWKSNHSFFFIVYPFIKLFWLICFVFSSLYTTVQCFNMLEDSFVSNIWFTFSFKGKQFT